MQIKRGKLNRPKKVVIYGPEGIGKTTLASQFPDPLFIDTEGSTAPYDVARLDAPTSYELMKAQIDWVISNRPCRTLVIDTMDWAEKLVIKKIIDGAGKSGIEDFGYGKGYTYVGEEMGRLLNQLERVIDAGMHVVITAHAAMRKFEQPDEMVAYDRWELKLSKQSAPLLKEWADIILFCNYKTYVVKENEKSSKGKAQGGRRVMHTSHHPCWDAKNRYGLPEQVDMSYEALREIIDGGAQSPVPTAVPTPVPPAARPAPRPQTAPPAAPPVAPEPEPAAAPAPPVPAPVRQIPQALADLMAANKVEPEEIHTVVSQKGYFPADMAICDYPPDFIDGVLVGAWDQVHSCILDNRDVPF